jgi:predicted ATPase
MAQTTGANQALYVVAVSASSGFFVKQSEKYLDENAVKKWYKYQEEERKKIQAVRQSINVVVDAGCARYFGLKIANDEAKKQITEAVLKADVEMKKIDITLKAEVEFVQLPGDS